VGNPTSSEPLLAHRISAAQRNPDSEGHHRMKSSQFSHFSLQLFALAIAVGLAGCASTGAIDPLEITLVSLQVGEMTVFETEMHAKLRVTNPNPEPFAIEGASFKLYLDDRKVGTGTTPEFFTVERLESTVFDVVFHINNASALLRLREIIEDQEVTYGVRGSLFTQGTFGTKKIKVAKTGSIDLNEFSPAEPEVPKLDDTPQD
jgi:LEA14-like dessication related protein